MTDTAIFLATLVVMVGLLVWLHAVERKRDRLLAELDHMKREIEFMKPILDRLYSDIVGHWHAGDYAAYEKTRRELAVMERRWQWEITEKLNR